MIGMAVLAVDCSEKTFKMGASRKHGMGNCLGDTFCYLRDRMMGWTALTT